MKSPQVFEEIRLENAKASQIVDVIRGKVQIPDIFDDLFQARRDGVSAVAGVFSVKSVKDDDLVGGVFKISCIIVSSYRSVSSVRFIALIVRLLSCYKNNFG